MYELDYLYEQLKKQTFEQMFIDALDSVFEACYDTAEPEKKILETVQLIEEASKKNRFTMLDKLKAGLTKVDTVLKKYKEPASQCKPIGLEYKGFKTFADESAIKKLHTDAINYLNKFNPDKASEEELKKYIMDSGSNVQYKEIYKIFKLDITGAIINLNAILVTSEKDKEITKNDISDAIKYLEKYGSRIKELQAEAKKLDDEFTKYSRDNTDIVLTMSNTDGDIIKLRKKASMHKRSLISIADDLYYQVLISLHTQETAQAKRIVVKAANYNPRNLKESYVVQTYIDAMYDFHESTEVEETTKLNDKRRHNVITPNKLLNKHLHNKNVDLVKHNESVEDEDEE